jgi:hypothetical protein
LLADNSQLGGAFLETGTHVVEDGASAPWKFGSNGEPMDCSLARGLASRFMTEHFESSGRSLRAINRLAVTTPGCGFTKRTQWKNWATRLRGAVMKAAISDVEQGSAAKKVRVVHYLGGPLTNPLTQWEEEAIPVQVLATAYPGGVTPLEVPVRCLLGKHAIARLVQRSGRFDSHDARDIDFYALTPELAPLTSWSVVWTMLLAEALRSPGLRKSELMLPIPAPNGVFLATLCSEQPLVNVRTFIRDSQLSERQLALKEKCSPVR